MTYRRSDKRGGAAPRWRRAEYVDFRRQKVTMAEDNGRAQVGGVDRRPCDCCHRRRGTFQQVRERQAYTWQRVRASLVASPQHHALHVSFHVFTCRTLHAIMWANRCVYSAFDDARISVSSLSLVFFLHPADDHAILCDATHPSGNSANLNRCIKHRMVNLTLRRMLVAVALNPPGSR
jgi:hypothetical protein